MVAPAVVLGVGQAILALKGASDASRAAEEAEAMAMEGGALSKEASYANAADASRLGRMNASAINAAAQNNANVARSIGEANALAIQKSTLRNLQLQGLESNENLRRLEREGRWQAGEIRAMQAAGGISINSGSPLAYLNSEVSEGIRSRQFEAMKGIYTMLGMAEEGLTSSLLTIYSSQRNADVMEKNAAMQAEVTIAEADMQAAAMMRQGDIMAQVGVANASAARYQGQAATLSALGNAFSHGAQAYNAWQGATDTSSVWT